MREEQAVIEGILQRGKRSPYFIADATIESKEQAQAAKQASDERQCLMRAPEYDDGIPEAISHPNRHSDHPGRLYKVPVSVRGQVDQEICVYAINMYDGGAYCGTRELSEFAAFSYKGHLDKQVVSLQKISQKQGDDRVDIIAIQEGPSGDFIDDKKGMQVSYPEYFISQLRVHGFSEDDWEIVHEAEIWTLVRKEKLELQQKNNVYNHEQLRALTSNDVHGHLDTLKLKLNNSEATFILNNLHCKGSKVHSTSRDGYKSDSAKRRAYLDQLNQVEDMQVVTVGDVNIAVGPVNLTAQVPLAFSGDRTAYNSCDALLNSPAGEKTYTCIHGEVIDPSTANAFDIQGITAYEAQAPKCQYFDTINAYDEESFADISKIRSIIHGLVGRKNINVEYGWNSVKGLPRIGVYFGENEELFDIPILRGIVGNDSGLECVSFVTGSGRGVDGPIEYYGYVFMLDPEVSKLLKIFLPHYDNVDLLSVINAQPQLLERIFETPSLLNRIIDNLAVLLQLKNNEHLVNLITDHENVLTQMTTELETYPDYLQVIQSQPTLLGDILDSDAFQEEVWKTPELLVNIARHSEFLLKIKSHFGCVDVCKLNDKSIGNISEMLSPEIEAMSVIEIEDFMEAIIKNPDMSGLLQFDDKEVDENGIDYLFRKASEQLNTSLDSLEDEDRYTSVKKTVKAVQKEATAIFKSRVSRPTPGEKMTLIRSLVETKKLVAGIAPGNGDAANRDAGVDAGNAGVGNPPADDHPVAAPVPVAADEQVLSDYAQFAQRVKNSPRWPWKLLGAAMMVVGAAIATLGSLVIAGLMAPLFPLTPLAVKLTTGAGAAVVTAGFGLFVGKGCKPSLTRRLENVEDAINEAKAP